MSRWIVSGLLLTLITSASAESYRFDMGSATSPLAPGYTRVTPATLLSANPDYGWTRAPMTVIFRTDPDNPYYATQDTAPEFALYSDGVLSLEENSFVFRVPAGRYAVTAVIGDLAIGEARPGNSIWANGVQVATDELTNASVKAFRFPVAAPEGQITLRFRADSLQKYVTVIAVTAEAVAQDAQVAPSVQQYPTTPPGPAEFRANWEILQTRLIADWERAKAALTAEGVDLREWAERSATLRQLPGYREYWGWGLGSGAWERISGPMGGLPIGRLCTAFREMGIDGFSTNSGALVKELTAVGLKHAVTGSAEGFPRGDMTGVPLNLMKNADGSTTTVPRVWSNCAPEAIRTFQEVWRERLAAAAPGASFFVIDEPRGMWYAGRYGDVSEPAQAAFKRWAAEHGWHELAAKGIPERARSLDFYRFYQFRLQSVALLVRAFTRDTPVADVPTMPGNGNAGPEQMNHSCYWPPAMAQHGLVSATWAYDNPASCKMYAETLRIAEELGGQSVIVPPLYAEAHTPAQDLPMNTACISALTTRVLPWHFRGPTVAPNRIDWMKAVFYGARLTHATSGLTHTPPLYVWCPESIVYNDLVEFNAAEAAHWKVTWQALFDANLDYKVTTTLAVPPPAVVIYSCVRPVLSEEEFGRLQRFVAGGGTVLCTFTRPPEWPDGRPIAEWGTLPAGRVMTLDLSPAGLRDEVGQRGLARNWETGAAALKTYLYQREGTRVHLINNTDPAAPASFVLPAPVTDALSGARLERGATLTVRAAGYALLEERAQ